MRRYLVALALVAPAAVLAQTVDHPLQVGGDVKPPILIHQVEPQYSRAVLKQRTSTPMGAFVVDQEGVPHDLQLVHSSGSKEFDQTWLKAVADYRFRPATLRGKPVAVRLNMEINVDPF